MNYLFKNRGENKKLNIQNSFLIIINGESYIPELINTDEEGNIIGWIIGEFNHANIETEDTLIVFYN